MICQSSPWRRATSTSRMASTPAAIAAASGTRDCSGPTSGTVPGPATGLPAAATVDFACAAVCFAAFAMLRSPLVSASFGVIFGGPAEGAVGGAFFGADFLAAFLAGSAFFAALAGVFFGVLAGAFLAALAGWRLLLRRWRRRGRLRGRRGRRRRVRELRRGCRRRRGRWGVRLFVGSILLVGHQAAPLQCLLTHSTLTGHRQRSGHGQGHRHDCQLGERSGSRDVRGDAVRLCRGQPAGAVAPG